MNIDTTDFQSCGDIKGDDAEDSLLLKQMHQEARRFVSSHKWCGEIIDEYFAFGIGGMIAVFLFKIDPIGEDVDSWIWVVVGDVPPAYITTEDNDTWQETLEGYIFEMRRWCQAVKAGESTLDLILVNSAPSVEHASLLEKRLEFLEREFLK